MVPHQSAPFVLRPRRGMVLLVPALVVATALGCGHRRSSLRPVYVSPAPSCSPGAVVPGATTTAPAATTPSVLEPAAPSFDTSAAPSSTVAPPRPTAPRSEEPELNPVAPDSSSVPSVPKLQPPTSNGSVKTGRRSPSGRLRQAGLRERLIPYVNDPGDLFQPPKAERPWKYVVLHHSAGASGSYDQIDREHREAHGWDGCGYHFVIGNGTGSPDGRIEVARRWVDQRHGIHCRDGKSPDMSEYGIGICLVGDLDNAPPTPRQIAAAKALVAYLGARYQIPAEQIGTHANLAAAPTACPGKHFPIQAILGARDLARR
jgi:N-acetylmuramoyl-L-alanine amidase